MSSRAATTPPWKMPVCALSSSAYGRNASTASSVPLQDLKGAMLVKRHALSPVLAEPLPPSFLLARRQYRLVGDPEFRSVRRVCRSLAVVLMIRVT